MPAYAIAISKMKDRDLYDQYLAAASGTLTEFGGKVLVFNDNCDVVEPAPPGPRCVMIEFESKEKALAWYHSPGYQAAVPKRLGSTEGFFIIAEGLGT